MKWFVAILCFVLLVPGIAGSGEIYSKHFIAGIPLGAPESSSLLFRDLYVLSANSITKFADWVSYMLTPHETMGDLDLEREWKADPWLCEAVTLEPSPDDYRGASKQLQYDRGHLAPLGSFKGSRFASQVNYYSNIAPQKAGLNRGPWVILESSVRSLVKKYGTVWVMTGPLYERNMPSLPGADEIHVVPSGFWKIVAIKSDDDIRATAFIMDQEAVSGDLKKYLVTIDDVEKRSGLNFFWRLPDVEEHLLESTIFNLIGGVK